MSTPIPQPPGVPLLGNIFDVDPKNTWSSLKKLSEKYGEIFQIKVLGHTIVFVAGAALAEELCDEKRFRKYVGGPIVEIRYAVHDSLFTAFDHEESWGVAHRIIAPKLTPQSVAERFDDMLSTTNELLAKWKGLGPDEAVSAIGELNRLNLEATTLALFGKKLDCLTGPEHPMLKGMEDSTSEAIQRPNRPGFLNWLVFGGKFKKATATMRAYASEMVEHRRNNPSDRKDLLATLVSAADPESGKSLTNSQVIDEIVTMPIGSSTAPGLVSTIVYFLLKNPHVIATAREELDRVVGGAGGELTYSHLSQLKYVEGIVREGLRLSFAAPGFNIEPIPREGDKSPVLLAGGKYQVAHNQPMILVLAGVNRDPSVFEDPLAFKPERMVGEKYEQLPVGVRRSYGNGKRECIGKHYAWLWNMVVVAKLIKEVDFTMADPSYELKQDGWFNLRPVDFYVKVKPRVSSKAPEL
ncbi:cytochrome P450 [Colletotrichum higginsianum]|uniref:Cytochrome P450 n=2 Tax=Colletotrichum higginsianum TaxID=80884 RepID=H1V723_COLHI|nr:Cytochrome P450 [Colletotrichum higginsianum IMI 349063]OBR11124.1 Cytochrome P450 [Colletotrichum higginsianum IMI 349063]TIC90932.1 Bifunctional cytochrome P450/NADPH--P450 reductase [Colletotrichum higginsianum]GJD01351.1 cytochrome P450 [Colletotrichum higginsianum]CCF36025.1 cytochrome P450 [Colletotrichum higginsianum]